MPNIGGPELVFILVIVLIVFGAGKLPDVFGQLGKGVRTFRDASKEEPTAVASSTGGAATAAGAKYCANCGKPLAEGAKFCPSCGSPAGAA